MEIKINIDDTTPLFTQVIEQVKKAVSTGQLAPGAALPSIRQLANDLEINSKTIAKAYQLLERDQIIQTKGYRGTFIHPEAQNNCLVDLNARALEELTRAVLTLKAANLTDSEIRNAFTIVMNTHIHKGK